MKIPKILSIFIGLAFLVSGAAYGAIIKVPDDYPTIKLAIEAAVDGDTVLVGPGTYCENDGEFLGKVITVKSEAGPDVTTIDMTGPCDLNFSGGETEETILEGFTILEVLDISGNTSPTIKNCKFIGKGCGGGGGHGSIWGGSSPTFINSQILQGCAGVGGGYDIYDSSVTFIDCEFSDNQASSEGGALYIDESSSVNLNNCTIKDNTAGGNGGGIFNRGTLTISYSSIIENNGDFGSGIINYGTMSISNSTISDNGGNPESSGGIENAGNATLMNCTIQRNFGGEGAGIGNSGDITLINSNISDNDGSPGIGGILNFGSGTLINTTISGNKGYIAGGIDVAGGNVTLTNCTVSGNSASASKPSAGGGVTGPGMKLQNTIIARNTAPYSPDCFGEIISLDNNLIGDTTGCTITLQANDLIGDGDPGLGPFTDDGTPGNGHFPLLATSQAIDSGNDDACPSTDQVGNPRVDGDGDSVIVCDIGAIEFQVQIEVAINIHPMVLNLKNKGKRIISGIRLPEEYDPHDIARDSLELSIPSCSGCEVIYPSCGFSLWKRYLAFFPRQDLIDEIETMNLELPTKLDLKMTGKLDDGTTFEGLDTIWLKNKRKKWRKRK